MMRRSVSMILFLAAAVSAAQDSGTVSLSLSDASRRALANNSSLLIERENLSQADFAIMRARGAYDLSWNADVAYRDRTDPVNSIFSGAPDGILAPSIKGVDASTSFTQLLPTGASAQLFSNWGRGTTNNVFTTLSPAYTTGVGVSLRQPILRGLWIDPAREAIRIAAAQRGQSAERLKRVISDVLTQVDAAYWSLVAARRDVVSIASSVELAGQQLSETNSRVEVGVLGQTDIAQPTAEQERRRGNLALARQRVAESENALKRLMLPDPNDPTWSQEVVPMDDPESSLSPPTLPEALATAQTNRPEIAEAKAQRTVAEVVVEARRSDVLPRLDLVASYARRGLAGSVNPDAVDFNGGPITVPGPLLGSTGRSLDTIRENRFPDASIGVSFSVPITNRTARANLGIARSQLQQASLGITATQQQVEAEVRNAAAALDTARLRIDAARAERVAAETQLYAEQERFQVGLSTNFLVLTRQNDLTAARVTETSALTDYRKAATELARATGTLLATRQVVVDTGHE
ncbi:MAG: TolC family protein [Acidobacteriota bacterium]